MARARRKKPEPIRNEADAREDAVPQRREPGNGREEGDLAEEEPIVEVEAGVEVLPPALPEEEDYGAHSSEQNETPHLPAKRSAEVVPYDPLEAYLREIRTHPPLTKEEERELAIRYHKHRDLDAAFTLVTSNLWLVVKIARDYERAARTILDLIQEGNIGLMEAVKNFDPYRGVRFPSYAAWWIKAYIVRFIIANWRIVKIGTTQAQRKLFFNLKKEKELLERLGFQPAPKLLAEKLNVKESEVIDMEQRLSSPDVSVDSPIKEDSESDLLSVLPAQGMSAEDMLSRRELKDKLARGLTEFASTLKQNERVVFNERMLAEEKATLQEIAQKLSLSRERVRQIENRLRDKLKEFLQDRLGPSLEEMEF